VFRLERERRINGQTTVEVVYGITDLTRAQADARQLLALTRQHWGIENRLHHVRDETFGEDRCRVRRGHAPHVLASIRNIAVYLLDPQPDPSTAAATRRLAAKPHLALPWIGLADYTSE
jgi:predicted transposase YbfD/YdcC